MSFYEKRVLFLNETLNKWESKLGSAFGKMNDGKGMPKIKAHFFFIYSQIVQIRVL